MYELIYVNVTLEDQGKGRYNTFHSNIILLNELKCLYSENVLHSVNYIDGFTELQQFAGSNFIVSSFLDQMN